MDQYTDKNFAVKTLQAKGFKFPKYASANMGADSVAQLDSDLFANREKRLFPIDTPEHTFYSGLYFGLKGGDNETLNKHQIGILKQAIDMHGVKKDIADAIACLTADEPAMAKTASANTKKFAFVKKNSNGETKGYFPIESLESIIDSSNKLASVHNRIQEKEYVKIARNIVKAYNEIPTTEKDVLGNKYASFNQEVLIDGTVKIIDGEKLLELTQDRFNKTGNEKYKWIGDYIKSDAMGDQEYLLACQDLINNVDASIDSLDMKQEYRKGLNPYKYANTDLSVQDGIDFCKKNVKLAEVYVPRDVLLSKKEEIKAFGNNDVASKMFFSYLENSDDAIKASTKIAKAKELGIIPEEFILDTLRVVGK